ncbi:ABC transporter permease [Desertimonas flava]|uniref:ABC transporter permease n=1 Tax=Desertimonas flava TaxID=2064846 RepID=UPI000E342BDE|nr:ABC transporter permease subunit [Desertimonas flava]
MAVGAVSQAVTAAPHTDASSATVIEHTDRRPRLWDRRWFQRLVVWGGLVVIYEIAAIQVGDFFLPRLSDVVAGYGQVLSDGGLGSLIGSYRQMLAGFGLAVVIGVPLGLAIGVSSIARAMLGWIVDALFVTSMVALLPFIIMLAGTNFSFRVTVVFLFASFYLIMNPAAGVRSVDPELREMARSFDASRWRIVRSIVTPSVLPFILAGMRLGMGQAIQGMIVAELWITVDTGRRLQSLGLARKLGEFFALASMVVIVGVVLTQLLLYTQRRFTPWANPADVAR